MPADSPEAPDAPEPRVPERRRHSDLGYQPALDGVRAIGILSVLLYHAGVGWAQGGFLGVEAFFVLSGFLITSLLVSEWSRRGKIDLKNFWMRRARRLLPALFAVIIVVGIYQALAGPSKAVPNLLADGLAALFYIANWHQIWAGTNYFANTGPLSPFLHTWSLAIEEQFYLIWPLVVLGVLGLWHKRRTPDLDNTDVHPSTASAQRSLQLLLALAAAGAVASAIEMALLFHGGASVNRVYYGTDTRASGLLTGACLAIGLALWRARARAAAAAAAVPPPVPVLREEPAVPPGLVVGVAKMLLGAIGILGAAAVGYSFYAARDGGTGSGLYHFGMLGFDLATVAVIASVTLVPGGPIGWLLATWPMRSIGKISYGLYLWHWPLFVWMTQATTGLSGIALFCLRVSASFAVAIASYFLIEQPVRQRRWQVGAIRVMTPAAVIGAVASLVVATVAAPAAVVPTLSKQTGGTTTTIAVPKTQLTWTGTGKACKVVTAEIKAHGKVAKFYTSYHTCPPVRVALLGDSMALTLGFGLVSEQAQYGVLVNDEAQLGCSFDYADPGNWTGTGFGSENTACLTSFHTWQTADAAWHPQAIVVEMGYWDCYDRMWHGQDVNITNPAYADYVYSQMETFVRDVGGGGLPVVMLSVPWVDPPAQTDGSPQPAASAARHVAINRLLVRLAAQMPQVHVVDIDDSVSPGNHFNSKVNGHECRWSDGVHFYPYCGALLASHLLPIVRELVQARGGPGPSRTPVT